MTQHQNIAFIGGGNMARSLIGGLVQGGHNATSIRVCDPDNNQLQRLQQQFSISTSNSLQETINGAKCIVLAVKPQVLNEVVNELSVLVKNAKPLILSIAAGIRVQSISRWLANEHAIIRCMPNTPALIQAGASALFANSNASAQQRDLAEYIMRAAGVTLWVNEEGLLDAVTALSGSGPAYVFMVIEAMQNAGTSLGLDAEDSRLLALQTVFGAAKMALEDSEPVAELRQRVTSKGGTTERALASFNDDGIFQIFERAMTAAKKRSEELAEQLDQSGD